MASTSRYYGINLTFRVIVDKNGSVCYIKTSDVRLPLAVQTIERNKLVNLRSERTI